MKRPDDGVWCYWCQLAPATQFDHLVPKCQGGRNVPENLVPACLTCNSRKGGKNPQEYGAWLLRKARIMATICPRCGQGPGEGCTGRRGRILQQLHRERQEAAT